MLGAVRRFLVSWVPFLGRLLAEEETDSDEYPTLPAARVAVIGTALIVDST